MSISSITLVLASGFSLYQQIQLYKQNATSQLSVLAQVMSVNVAKDVASGNNASAQERLQALSAASMITNVHIYWLDESDRQDFFTSYNQAGQSSVASKIGQINGLYEGKRDDGVLEVAHPIVFAGNKVGDIYLRASTANLNYLVSETIFFHVIIFVFIIALGLGVVVRIQRVFTRPIENLSMMLQNTTRDRDYSVRAKASNIQEIDLLASAVNTTLERVEEIIEQQHEAENQHKKLNASLEQMVNQRTVALKEANQELIQTLEKLHQFQRQIVQNEKMASLGDMVAGVAHEVNTPIGLGVTASTMMLDRLVTIKEQFKSKTLKASSMARFIEEGEENLNIIYRNLNRAAELISSFKQVAVDQTSEISRLVNVKQLIGEILVSLRPKLKKSPHELIVNCPDDLYVETKAGPINQILINLIVNSLIHAFEDGQAGVITLSVEEVNEETLKFTYSDNGTGIPNSIRKRIFDPFVTTKRGQGGSGLGMHLVYNLVTQGLNGSISLTSEEGAGVEFVIIFPVTKK